MPRVIVTTTESQLPRELSVMLDEQVHTVNLNSDHSAAQLVERIAWAITDAEDAERSRVSATRSPRDRSRRAPSRAGRLQVAAR